MTFIENKLKLSIRKFAYVLIVLQNLNKKKVRIELKTSILKIILTFYFNFKQYIQIDL